MQNTTDVYYFQCLGFNGRYWTFWFYHTGPNIGSSEWLILEALPAQAKLIKEYCRKPTSKGGVNLTLDNGSTLSMGATGSDSARITATEVAGSQKLSLEYDFNTGVYDVMYMAVVSTIKLTEEDESLEQIAEHPLRRNLIQEGHG